ncbi:hypothetical protein, partial [Escherichia coli]|uniref:hypothetical protein n=1 Tax=Escherichia coli TaxID=562 RepID=UPI000AE4BF3E
ADRNRSHWSTSKTPSYTKSVSWQHHLAYKSNIQRKLDNQYYTEAEASLARGRISGAENIVKNDATHFCVTQGKKMQIVELKTEGIGLHGVARLTFKCGE